MKRHLVLLSLVFCGITLCAQSTWHTTYVPYLRHINSVAVLSPDKVITAGGNEFNDSLQALFFSGDQGLSWELNPLDDISAWIKSIDFADSLNGIGVGYSGKMVRTVDGGHVWAKTVTPVSNTRHFNKVFFLDAQTGFVAGGWPRNDSIRTILKSTDGGNTWSILYDQPGFWLRSVHFTDALNGIAVGDSGTILRTTNGGTAWTPVAAPVIRNFNSIAFVSSTTGYIVGGSTLDSLRTILQTIDGGQSWTILLDEPGGILTDISFTDQSMGHLVGDKTTLMKTTNGGQTWAPETVTGAQPDEYFNAVRFYDNNFGIIGAREGIVHVFTHSELAEVTTEGARPLDSVMVTLSATLNTHDYPANYFFVFSTDPNLASVFTTYPTSKTSNVPVLVDYTLGPLVPHTTYYYAAKVTTLEGTVYGDTLSFVMELPEYTVETMMPMNANTQSVTLQGYVDKLPAAMNLSFEYGTTPSFGNTVIASPATVNDTFYHAVTAQINTLIPYTFYYYRLKATAGAQNYYGTTRTFFSGNIFSDFQALPASNTTDSTAILNGSLNKFRVPVTLSFEYGTDPNMLGFNVPASPASINDTLQHNVSAVIGALQPFTVYYYRLKAQSATGNFYTSTISFTTGYIFSDFQTLPVTNINGASATFNGTLDKFQFPVALSFEYGTTGLLGNSVTAMPANVSDTLQHDVTATVTNLLPNATYYFRLKGQTSVGTVYGLTLSFNTGNPFSVFDTKTATDVTTQSALLHGSIAGATDSTIVGFDYGTTLSFGNFVSATPGIITDPLQHDVSAEIAGLSTDLIYYYRLSGRTASGNQYYGDTMQVFTGYSALPNWDFQHWRDESVEQPVEWSIFNERFEKAPGRTGSALKIFNTNVALLGLIADDIRGGQAFSARPDSVTCYLNYNIEPNDTGFWGVFLTEGNNAVSQNFFPIIGNSGGQFVKFTFPLSYQSAALPDSLAVAFVPGAIIGDKPATDRPNNFMIIDDISFSASAPAVVNGNFETWFTNQVQRPHEWDYLPFIYIDSAGSGNSYVSRVLFDAPGDYALKIQNTQYKGGLLSMDVSNYRKVLWDGEHGSPVKARHNTLNGYYRFFPENNDTMDLSLTMYNGGVQVGNGSFRTWNTISDFTPFEMPITYFNSAATPDSVVFSMRPCAREPRGLSSMEIDKLSFDGFTTGIDPTPIQTKQHDAIQLFPNPATDVISIQVANSTGGILHIYNLAGKLMLTTQLAGNKTEISTADFTRGLYIVRILQEGKKFTDKFIVVK